MTAPPFHRIIRRLRPLFRAGAMLALAITPFFAFAGAARSQAGITDADISTLMDPAKPENNPAAVETPSIGRLFFRMAVALGVVLGLMAGVLWLTKRYLPQAAGKSARGRGIEVLATRVIGQRRSLMLVRVGEKTLLLGVTPQAIQTLSEMEPEEMPGMPGGMPEKIDGSWRNAARAAGLHDASESAADDFRTELRAAQRGTTSLEPRG